MGSVITLSRRMDLAQYAAWAVGQGHLPNTIANRVAFARQIAREIDLPAIGQAALALWLSQYEGWTQRTYFGHLSSLTAWLVSTGQRADDPMVGLRAPRSPKPRPRPLAAEEVTTLLTRARGNTLTWQQLALYEGLRRFEIAKFRGEHVTRTGLYVVGKGGKAATLPTHPIIWEVAQQYPRDGYWFPSSGTATGHIHPESVGETSRRLFRRCGLGGGIHRLRATFGTELLRNGANIKVVQELLRHDSLSSTEHYLGVDQDELAAAIGSIRMAA